MWNCKKCNEEIEDVFDECWNCKRSLDATTENFYIKKDIRTAEKKNGCLINVLSVIAAVLGLCLGVVLQLFIFNEAGPDIGIIPVALASVTYYYANKKIKLYFRNKTKP